MRSSSLCLAAAVIACQIAWLAASPAPPCDPGWRHLERAQACFRFIPGSYGFGTATRRCQEHYANAATIGSSEENELVRELAHGTDAWIGAISYEPFLEYSWVDGTPFGYFERWQGGYRPDIEGTHPCVKIDGYGEWFTSCCRKMAAIVCKKQASYMHSNNKTKFVVIDRS